MRELTILFAGAGALALCFAACSSDPQAGPAGAVDGGRTSSGGDAATSDAEAGASGDGGCVDPTPGPLPSPLPKSACDPNAKLAQEEKLALSTPDIDSLVAVTPDERTIVFTTKRPPAASTLWVADRASASSAFGAPVEVPFADPGPIFVEEGALAPDGLSLVVASAERDRFVVVSRDAAGKPFGAPVEGPLADVNKALVAGDGVDHPVLSADGLSFYFFRTRGEEGGQLRATRPTLGATFGAPQPVPRSCLLEGGAGRRVMTAIAKDELAAFFVDEADGTAFVAFRPAPGFAFTRRQDLGKRRQPTPNAACSAVYYSTVGSGADLFVGR